MSGGVDDVLAAIDGALADPEIPDGMRWSPDPAAVPGDPWADRFDGDVVPQPAQRYEDPDPRPLLSADCGRMRHEGCDGHAGRCLCSCHDRPRLSGGGVLALGPGRLYLAGPLTAPPRPTPELLERITAAGRGFGEFTRALVEAARPAFDQLALQLGELRAAPREKDPRAYALELRRTRGTGPDRQRQHQPRPRRHT